MCMARLVPRGGRSFGSLYELYGEHWCLAVSFKVIIFLSEKFS